MEDAGKSLTFRIVVCPERRNSPVGRNDAAAEKGYAGASRFYSCPCPAAHVKCPVPARDPLGITDLEAGARGPGGSDADAITPGLSAHHEPVGIRTHHFSM